MTETNDWGRLERVRIEGFRSIRSLDLELRPLNVLIGPNGAGKSNLIGFFELLGNLQQGDLQIHVRTRLLGAERTLHFGRKLTSQLAFELDFPSNRYRAVLIPTDDDGLVFGSEHGDHSWYEGDKRKTKTVPLAKPGDRESGLPSPGSGTIEQYVARWISRVRVHHFHDTSAAARVKGTSSVHDCESLRPEAQNLAAFLRNVQATDVAAYEHIVKSVRRVAPFFQGFVFQIEPGELIRLRWKHEGSTEYFDATMLSDGTLRFICLATLLLQPDPPGMLIIDEPELGLHPFAIQVLGGLIRSAGQRTQILVSTQSVTLANEFGCKDIVVVDRANGASSFRRLPEQEVEHWLSDYRMGDIWEKNLIGGSPD